MTFQYMSFILDIKRIIMAVDDESPTNPIKKKYQCGPIAKRY
jgi:hypothetical protein